MKEIIRNLNKDDYNDVLVLLNQVHLNHYKNRPDLYNNVRNSYTKEEFLKIINDDNSITLGLELEKTIIAVIIANIKETVDNPIIKKRKYCYIDSIVVDVDHRKKGYAKKLFEELKKKIKELNINNIELTVWPFNQDAISFYESIGMKIKNIRYEINC